MGRYQNEKQEKEGILSKQGWGSPKSHFNVFTVFFLQVRLLQNEKSDKKLVNWAKIPILGGRVGVLMG